MRKRNRILAQVRTVPVDPFWCLKASEREGTAVLFSIAVLQPDLLSGLSVRDDTVSRVLVPLRRPAFLLGSDRYGQVLIVLYDAHAEVWRCRKKGGRACFGEAPPAGCALHRTGCFVQRKRDTRSLRILTETERSRDG